jgi:hypothetical protein
MIIFYSIFILVLIVILLLCVNQFDNDIDNINIVDAHIYNLIIEDFNIIHNDLNVANKIHVYKHLMLYRLKILFKYKVNFENYDGYFYLPDEKYYTYDQINVVKKYLQIYPYLFVFYNKNNPKQYWID